MRCAGHVARMGKRFIQRLVRKHEVKAHLGDTGVDGRIISRWVFRKWDIGHGMNTCASGYGQVAGTCECGNEPLCFIKCGEFLD
jgi:hypothetical protein